MSVVAQALWFASPSLRKRKLHSSEFYTHTICYIITTAHLTYCFTVDVNSRVAICIVGTAHCWKLLSLWTLGFTSLHEALRMFIFDFLFFQSCSSYLMKGSLLWHTFSQRPSSLNWSFQVHCVHVIWLLVIWSLWNSDWVVPFIWNNLWNRDWMVLYVCYLWNSDWSHLFDLSVVVIDWSICVISLKQWLSGPICFVSL